MTSKKILFNATIIVVLSFFTAYYLQKSSAVNLSAIVLIDWKNYIIVTAWVYFCFAYISFAEKLVYSTFCKYPYKTAMLTTLCGNLGSAVSPLKTAHFPMKVYAHSNSGIALNQTLTGITKCQIIFSLTSIFVYFALSVALVILGYKVEINNISIPLYLVTSIGFVTNFSVFLLLFILTRNDKIQNLTLNLLYCVTKFFRRKTEKEVFIKNKKERLRLFREQTSLIFVNIKSVILPSILYSVYMFLSCFAPYVCYLCVTNASFSIIECAKFYLLTLSLTYLVNVVPVPGGCVVSEYVFSVVFFSALGNSLLQTLFLWRVCTYYIPIVINFAIFFISSFVGKNRIEKSK